MKGITSNFDLIKLAKKMNIDLTAVIYKDDLKRFDPKKNGSYIIDLHDHDNTSTGHWLMLYIKGNKAIYFDSFGIIYPTIIKEFCGNRIIEWNDKMIQSFESEWCGQYCLACLWHLQHGGSLKQFKTLFN